MRHLARRLLRASGALSASHDRRSPRLAGAAADAVAAARRVVGVRAVPILLDGDHLAEIEPGALQPQDHAPDRASADAEALCRPDHRNQLPAVDLEHVPGGGDIDGDLAGARRYAGLSAGAPALRRRDTDFLRRRRDLPGAAAALVRAAGRPDQPARPRRYADRRDPDLPDPAGPVLRLAADGLFPHRADRARGRRPDRRRQPAADPGQDRAAAVWPGL